uniref:Uncharacterized protein n=1 Tax=Borrelia hermsii TaxID=140 RepID=S4VMY5_BORHE|nr:hypothetical protein BHA054 [Borrelia hermsii]
MHNEQLPQVHFTLLILDLYFIATNIVQVAGEIMSFHYCIYLCVVAWHWSKSVPTYNLVSKLLNYRWSILCLLRLNIKFNI